MSVPSCVSSAANTSRTSRWTAVRPLRGGSDFTTRSEKSSNPTLSWFDNAAIASNAVSSAARAALERPAVPKHWLPETSTMKSTVSSRSSLKRLTKGSPMRAVTFQSMARTSSPG